MKKLSLLFLLLFAWSAVAGEMTVPDSRPHRALVNSVQRVFNFGTGALYPAAYAVACTYCSYLVIGNNDPAGTSDSSVVFRIQGNARGEIGLVGSSGLTFKTVSGTYPGESFSTRMYIMGASDATPGNIGIGGMTNPGSLLDVGTTAGTNDCQIDYVGNLICTATVQCTNVSGNCILSASGQKTSGNGAWLRIRNPTDGTVGYFGADSGISGGTNYHQIDIQAAQADGILCESGGGLSTCGFKIDSGNNLGAPGGGTPTCGAGCSSINAGSTNTRGSAVTGTAVSSVVINWNTTLGSAPFCTVSDSSTLAFANVSSVSTSALTINLSAALTTATIYWVCIQ